MFPCAVYLVYYRLHHQCANLLKYSDDSTLVTSFTQSEDHTLYQGNVDWLVKWCDKNILIFNTVKTEEIIFGKPSSLQSVSLLSPVKKINRVPTYKYLAVMIGENLSWTSHIEFTCKKIQQHIYFLRSLRSFEASSQIIHSSFSYVTDSECNALL